MQSHDKAWLQCPVSIYENTVASKEISNFCHASKILKQDCLRGMTLRRKIVNIYGMTKVVPGGPGGDSSSWLHTVVFPFPLSASLRLGSSGSLKTPCSTDSFALVCWSSEFILSGTKFMAEETIDDWVNNAV